MVQARSTFVVGVFQDQTQAVQAVREAKKAGFEMGEVALVAREWIGGKPPEDVMLQQAAGDAAVTGAATGAGVGAVAGAVGAALIPGAGPVLAGGLLLGALGGAAMGAAAGTFVAPFVAMKFAEEEANAYASHIEAGRTVVIIRTEDRQEEAKTLLKDHGAYDDSMTATP